MMTKPIVNIFILITVSFLAGFFAHRAYAIYKYQKPTTKTKTKTKKRELPSDFEIPRVKKWLVKYQNGMPLFSDRNYYNRTSTTNFDSCYLLTAPRHDTIGSTIISNTDLTIYRLIPEEATNKEFSRWLSNWKHEDIHVNVIGGFMDQKKVVSKKFKAQDTIILLPSGRKSATPILLLPDSNPNFSIKILQ